MSKWDLLAFAVGLAAFAAAVAARGAEQVPPLPQAPPVRDVAPPAAERQAPPFTNAALGGTRPFVVLANAALRPRDVPDWADVYSDDRPPGVGGGVWVYVQRNGPGYGWSCTSFNPDATGAQVLAALAGHGSRGGVGAAWPEPLRFAAPVRPPVYPVIQASPVAICVPGRG